MIQFDPLTASNTPLQRTTNPRKEAEAGIPSWWTSRAGADRSREAKKATI